jgi:SAM-dependent methyltransferase
MMRRLLPWLREKVFDLRHSFPKGLRVWAKQHPVVRRVLLPHPRWGNLRRNRPFGLWLGVERGQPIDRIYIEDFLGANASDVSGVVLEIQNAAYTHAYGGRRVQRSEVVDIEPSNEAATLVADLSVAGALPAQLFDCVILTQTLQYVADPRQAVRNVHDSLRTGGVALITVPCGNHRIIPGTHDRWRFTPEGLETMLREVLPVGSEIDVGGRGGFLANVGFLYGLAVQDLSIKDLEVDDADYPLVATARLVRHD